MRRNKYNVAPKDQRTVDGIVFASKRESTRYQELCLMQKCGDITDLELQPRFPFPMGFSYVADFQYTTGRTVCAGAIVLTTVIVEDVKGVETAVFRIKRLCMLYFYPNLEFKVVK